MFDQDITHSYFHLRSLLMSDIQRTCAYKPTEEKCPGSIGGDQGLQVADIVSVVIVNLKDTVEFFYAYA